MPGVQIGSDSQYPPKKSKFKQEQKTKSQSGVGRVKAEEFETMEDVERTMDSKICWCCLQNKSFSYKFNTLQCTPDNSTFKRTKHSYHIEGKLDSV